MKKIGLTVLLTFICLNVNGQSTDDFKILNDINLEKVEEEYYFSYLINDNVTFYKNLNDKTSTNIINVKRLYTIKRIEDSFWYVCITDAGIKGFVDLSTIGKNFSYNDDELEIIQDDKRFLRYGPLLIIKNNGYKLEFEDVCFWEDSTFYSLEYVGSGYFVIHERYFEANKYQIYKLENLKYLENISGVPVVIDDRNILVSCGRFFYPNDLLMIFEIKNSLKHIYSAEVVASNEIKLNDFVHIDYYDNKIYLNYKNEKIEIELNDNNIPISNINLRSVDIE